MNYLAHIMLARHSEDAMIGAFLGDFMRPADARHLPQTLQLEMWLHRYIDSYTDTHPEVRAARQLCSPPLRLFARIALDVYFDHFLTRHWSSYCEQSLDAVAKRFYRAIRNRSEQLPLHVQVVISRMYRRDWLRSYRHYQAVERAVQGIGQRLSRKSDHLVAALAELRDHEAEVEQRFLYFFPELIRFSEQRRARIIAEADQASAAEHGE